MSTLLLYLTCAVLLHVLCFLPSPATADAVPAGYEALPYYPAPYGGWSADVAWADAYARAARLVANMTLAEKTNVTAGTGYFMGRCVGNTGSVPRLGFPSLCLQDGATGLRATQNNTAFPAGVTAGATWSKALLRARGRALGAEFRGKGVHYFLGPVVGPLGRKPRGGRGWEGFGADPVLQAKGAAETVRGVQEAGVAAVLKHLVGYEQEMFRMYNLLQPGYSANIDDRTMHELYLWPFAAGVRAGAAGVMTAYNAVNGSAGSQNSQLVNGLLKAELGFQGVVMSDWLGQIGGVSSALAGLDMAMPGDGLIPLLGDAYWMSELTTAVLNGSVPVDRLNDMVARVVAVWYRMGQDAGFPAVNFDANTDDRTGELYPGALISPTGVVNLYVDVQGNHSAVAKSVAQEGITLLKNNGSFLPLGNGNGMLSVFGTDAQANADGINSCVDKSCNTGTLTMGWGSGSANLPYLDDPIGALRRRVGEGNVTFYNTDTFPTVPAPNASDVALVFLTSDSGENSYTVESNYGDRSYAGLGVWYGGDALVQAAAAVFSNVVVVIHTVGPVTMEAWVDLPQVKAVLVAHLPGQEAGDALVEVLYGDVSPSGHLPYSIPREEADYPDSVGLTGDALGQVQDTYSEGLYIDYRYLNKNNITARYAFGHGLSYTTFAFSAANITQLTTLTPLPPARPAPNATVVASLNATIPAAAEAVGPPAGFVTIWRYLYSWLSAADADAAAAVATTGTTYPYPEGYSTNQTARPLPAAGGADGGNPALWDVVFRVSVTVTNTGTSGNSTTGNSTGYAGKAVAQAYVELPADTDYYADTPVRQLRDFAKTGTLAADGGQETVVLELTRKDVSVWDVVRQNWVVPGADNEDGNRFKVWIGMASDDLQVVCYTDTLECSDV